MLRYDRGFTLLELLIVLALIGLMSGLVVPRFSGSLTTIQAKSAVNKIGAILRYARNKAVTEQIDQKVSFDFDQGLVTLSQLSREQPPEVDPTDSREDAPPAEETLQTYRLPDKVHLREGITPGGETVSDTFRFLFSPAGNSSGGTIVIEGKEGVFYRITVDFITGIVKID